MAPPSELVTLTCALAMLAPLGSWTVPVIYPVSWADVNAATARQNHRRLKYFIAAPDRW